AFQTALAGLYKLSGVDLTHEQIAAALAPAAPRYHLTRCGLVAGPGADGRPEVVYPLDDGAVCLPYVLSGAPVADLPGLERRRLVFRETPVLWQEWVEAWQRDQAGQGTPEVPAAASVLPAFGCPRPAGERGRR